MTDKNVMAEGVLAGDSDRSSGYGAVDQKLGVPFGQNKIWDWVLLGVLSFAWSLEFCLEWGVTYTIRAWLAGRAVVVGLALGLSAGPWFGGTLAVASDAPHSDVGVVPVTHSRDAAPHPADAAWGWRLTGLVIGPGLREAMLAKEGETRAVLEGETVDGWTVTLIGRGEVTVQAGGKARVLKVAGMSPDELAALARERAAENTREDEAVVAASRQHDLERDEAAATLLEATRRMTAR